MKHARFASYAQSVLFLVLSLGLLAGLRAQDLGDDTKTKTLKKFELTITSREKSIDHLQSRANYSFGLGIAITILGIVSAASSSAKNGSSPSRLVRYLPIAIGAIISITSEVRRFKFPYDPQELQNVAETGRGIIDNMKVCRDEFAETTTVEERDELRQRFSGYQKQLEELLEAKSNQPTSKSTRKEGGALWFFESPVYAKTSAPPWVSTPPSDNRSYQVVGMAISEYLSEAKGLSFDTAVRAIAKQALAQGKGDQQLQAMVSQTAVGAMNDFVAQQATIIATYFDRDPSGKYRYYTLLRINKDLISPELLPRARVQNTLTIPLPTKGTQKVVVPVAAPKANDGSFEFTFNVTRRSDGQFDLELGQIKTIEDGSVGTTRWYFDVSANKVQRFSLPEARYSDKADSILQVGQKVTLPAIQGSSLAITVAGYKPKDFK